MKDMLKNGKKVYIVTKLFNIHDRMVSVKVNIFLNKVISEMVGYMDEFCFLPYRDTDSITLKLDNKAQAIYELDKKALENSCLVVGFLDGPCHDSGVGYEVGYAFSKGIPVIILSTDYFKLRSLPDGKLFSIDPFIELFANVIHIQRIFSKSHDYLEGLKEHEDKVFDKLSILLYEVINGNYSLPNFEIADESTKYDLFIEIGGQKYEWCDYYLETIENICKVNRITYYISKRYTGKEDLFECSRRDICACKNSTNVLIVGDGQEMDIGSSIIHGYAHGLNKNIILLCTNKFDIYEGENHIMYRNLMLEYSANKVIRSIKELESVIAHL